MIRIAICDDEKKILDEVSEYIRNYSEKKKQDLSSTVSAKITTLEDSINLCVKTETLDDYYTKTQTDSAINVSKVAIILSVV